MKMMQPVADALKNDHTVLAVDLPGHGESGRPPEPWGVPEYAECVLQLLEKLSFAPCQVVAHSFGCRIAAWIEAEHPDVFEKIVFTGAAGIRPKQTEEEKDALAEIRKLAPGVAAKMTEMLNAPKVPAIAKVRILEIILERTYGKPEAAVGYTPAVWSTK